MKILVAPDKFKGCLTSLQAADLIGKAFEKHGFDVATSPLADGGEGTVEAILSATGGLKLKACVQDPLGRKIESFFGLINESGIVPRSIRGEASPGKNQAVIEMAAASGLYLLSNDEHNPLKTSSYGTGQLIKAALNYLIGSSHSTNRKGTVPIPKIIIGVGGSATNDGGMGAAAALGAKFSDINGHQLKPIGENLINVADIDLSDLDKRVKNTEVTVAVDVDNPFYGQQGAAFIYGPQKGADVEQVKFLDKGLINLAGVVKEKIGIDLQAIPGSGAAGGLAGGLVAFMGAEIKPGTKYICHLLGLSEKIQNADVVITGEGRVDEQTLRGKAPTGVINLAIKNNKPIFFITGQLGSGYEKLKELGVNIYTLSKGPEEVEQHKKNPKPAIERVVNEIARAIDN